MGKALIAIGLISAGLIIAMLLLQGAKPEPDFSGMDKGMEDDE